MKEPAVNQVTAHLPAERNVNWDYFSFGNINGSLSINRSLRSVFTLHQFLPSTWSAYDIESFNRYRCRSQTEGVRRLLESE